MHTSVPIGSAVFHAVLPLFYYVFAVPPAVFPFDRPARHRGVAGVAADRCPALCLPDRPGHRAHTALSQPPWPLLPAVKPAADQEGQVIRKTAPALPP